MGFKRSPIRSVFCVQCGARPGTSCLNNGGRPVAFHVARRERWAELAAGTAAPRPDEHGVRRAAAIAKLPDAPEEVQDAFRKLVGQ